MSRANLIWTHTLLLLLLAVVAFADEPFRKYDRVSIAQFDPMVEPTPKAPKSAALPPRVLAATRQGYCTVFFSGSNMINCSGGAIEKNMPKELEYTLSVFSSTEEMCALGYNETAGHKQKLWCWGMANVSMDVSRLGPYMADISNLGGTRGHQNLCVLSRDGGVSCYFITTQGLESDADATKAIETQKIKFKNPRIIAVSDGRYCVVDDSGLTCWERGNAAVAVEESFGGESAFQQYDRYEPYKKRPFLLPSNMRQTSMIVGSSHGGFCAIASSYEVVCWGRRMIEDDGDWNRVQGRHRISQARLISLTSSHAIVVDRTGPHYIPERWSMKTDIFGQMGEQVAYAIFAAPDYDYMMTRREDGAGSLWHW